MTPLSRFAKLLGLPHHQAEDALHSERAARAVLTRRSFFAAGGAMAASLAFSFPVPKPPCLIMGAAYSWADIEISLGAFPFLDYVPIITGISCIHHD